MAPTINDLLCARAAEMAAQDGVSVGPAQIFGAASQLQAELLTARDNLLAHPDAPHPAPAEEVLPAPADETLPPSAPADDEPAADDAA